MKDSFYKSPPELEIQNDDIEVEDSTDIINFEGDNISVTSDGEGKVTVSISDDTTDGLYRIDCPFDVVCGKIIPKDVIILVDDSLCFLTRKGC